MRRICFLLFLLGYAAVAVVAQESIPQDTTLYVEGRKVVIHEENGKIKVKMYEARMPGDTIENTQVFEGVYLNGRSIEQTTVSTPFVKKSKNYNYDPHHAFLYVAFDKLSSSTFRYSSKYPQNNEKSFEFGVNLFCGGVTFDARKHWGMTTAMGLSYTAYRFDGNYAFEKTAEGTSFLPAPEEMEYQRSTLRYWAYRQPVSMEWQTLFGKNTVFLSVGPELELRFKMKSRVKYDNKKHTLASDLNYNPIGLNLLLQAGYGDLMLIARFGLTPLLAKSRAPEVYHSSIGIGICW